MLKFGHRGAMGYEPENTLASFAKALELKVDIIELDVHLCKSGEVVVIHDDRVDRTTDGKGFVAEMTLDELKKLDAGKGERIPTLAETLDFVDRRAAIDIELKAMGVSGAVTATLRKYIDERGWKEDMFILSSFDHPELMECHRLIPSVPYAPILAGKPVDYARFAETMGAFALKPYSEFLDEKFICDAHDRGLKVFVWTLNRPAEIKKFAGMGVDGIIGNFPDRF